MKDIDMKHIISILMLELKPQPVRAGIAVLINILSTLLLYLLFIVGLGLLLPRIQFVDIQQWMTPGIIGFITGIIAFNIPLQDSFHYSQEIGLTDQILSSPLLCRQVYLVKSLIYWLKSAGHLLLSTLVLLIVGKCPVNFGFLVLFWLYYLLGLLSINQFGIMAGIISTNLKIRSEFTIIFIMIIFLVCGIIVPSFQYSGVAGTIIHYFPASILFEGGRDILVYHTIGTVNLIYLALLAIVSYFISYFLYKRRNSR